MYLEVNGIDWDIKCVKPNSKNLYRSDGSLTLGVTDINTKCVYLSSVLNREQLYRVLCHELCHVYIFSYGYYLDLEEEERLAQFIAVYGKTIIGDTDHILGLIKGTDRSTFIYA